MAREKLHAKKQGPADCRTWEERMQARRLLRPLSWAYRSTDASLFLEHTKLALPLIIIIVYHLHKMPFSQVCLPCFINCIPWLECHSSRGSCLTTKYKIAIHITAHPMCSHTHVILSIALISTWHFIYLFIIYRFIYLYF